MEELLTAASRKAGVRADVTARAKETASFAKKIITKNYSDPWAQVTDKIGARIIVDESNDTHRVFDGLAAAGITLRATGRSAGPSGPQARATA
jgi:ppGpp synthetase/RelA/SpoT-type nucleotidyltranferase